MRALLPLVMLSLIACFDAPRDSDDDDDGPGGGGWMGDTGWSSDGGSDGGHDGGSGDGGSGDGGSGDGGSGDGGGTVDLSEDCHPDIEDWPGAWANIEEQVVELTNQARAAGQDCGSYGRFPSVGPVEMDPALRCAARYHSLWMADTNVFDHYSYGGDLGDDPWERMDNAGFTGSGVGENIAAGYPNAAQVVQGWIDSDGHCANLMSDSAELIGVGYFEGGSYGTWWTQNFGR